LVLVLEGIVLILVLESIVVLRLVVHVVVIVVVLRLIIHLWRLVVLHVVFLWVELILDVGLVVDHALRLLLCLILLCELQIFLFNSD
jgi:hypothetical protein